MKLSIVTTMYGSASYIKEFHARAKAAAEKITGNYEIIFVNDGSPDPSLDVAVSVCQKDPRVVVVDLSRNFGHYKAMMTGLMHATGDTVFLIDCDLEEAPELLDEFHKKFKSSGADVVYGVQKKRKGGVVERVTGALFYRIFNALSHADIPENLVTARLMSRRYVDALLEYRERELFMAGVWRITGFEQVPLEITKLSRGETSYTFGKKLSVVLNGVTSFSNTPLIFIFYAGGVISAISAAYVAYLVARKAVFGIPVDGWTSLIVSVWFLGGLTILFIGIIGIYLSKIFVETKNRPYTTVRAVYGRGEAKKPSSAGRLE